MKKVLRNAVVAALGTLAVSSGPSHALEGVVHVGHSGDVRALLRTGNTLWIGTAGGLYRYDLGAGEFVGRSVVGERLPSNSIRALAAKGDSVLVGTDAGLAVYDGKTAAVYTDERRGRYDSLSFDRIRSIDPGRRGEVYLGTYGHGVQVMSGRRGYAITREDSLLDDKVYGVVEGENGAVYFATSMGLCAHRDSAWVGFQAGAGIPRGDVRRVIDADRGRMVLLVGVGGVYGFDGNQATNLSPEGVLEGDDIADLARGDAGALWVAGRFGGIAVYQGGRWTRVAPEDAAVNAAPWRCAHADAEGGVYFGSADGLVVTVRDDILVKIRVPAELPSGAVRSIVAAGEEVLLLSGARVVRASRALSEVTIEDAPDGLVSMAAGPDGAVWAAGRWGVFERTAKGYAEFAGFTGDVDPAFTAVCVDARGRVWTARRTGAVDRYDGELWVPMGDPEELFDGPVDGLRAGAGAVWAYASRAGVARHDHAGWTVFPTDSFAGEDVRDLAASGQGAVVVATPRRLWLYRDDSPGWQPLEIAGGGQGGQTTRGFIAPPSRSINRVVFDESGNMYLGTDGGLGVVGAGGVRWFGPEDGLGGVAIRDVFVEGADAVWVGFRSDGLSRIPMKSLW